MNPASSFLRKEITNVDSNVVFRKIEVSTKTVKVKF